MSDLKELVKLGARLYIFYSDGNINNRIVHIRAIVDDEWIVWRIWSRKRRRWLYHVGHISRFEYLYEQGHLSTQKPRE
jgi:hypothetical protein